MQKPIHYISMPGCQQPLIANILRDYFECNYAEVNQSDATSVRLVIYRHPLVSAVHEYWNLCKTDPRFATNDSVSQWEEFCHERLKAARQFFDQHLEPSKGSDSFWIENDRYIQGPFKPLCQLIACISPDHKPNIYKIAMLLGRYPYPKDNSFLSLKHYDMEFFKRAEQTILDLIDRLDIPTYFVHE
jgi:hypothetical protein